MSVKARFCCTLQILGHRVSSQSDENRANECVLCPERTGKVVTVHTGQPDIAEYDVWMILTRSFESLGCVVRNLDIVSSEFQYVTKSLSRIHVVFDDKDAPPPRGI